MPQSIRNSNRLNCIMFKIKSFVPADLTCNKLSGRIMLANFRIFVSFKVEFYTSPENDYGRCISCLGAVTFCTLANILVFYFTLLNLVLLKDELCDFCLYMVC